MLDTAPQNQSIKVEYLLDYNNAQQMLCEKMVDKLGEKHPEKTLPMAGENSSTRITRIAWKEMKAPGTQSMPASQVHPKEKK